MRRIVVIAHDMRSAHNVGSLLRTAEGLNIEKVYLSGYTPYPLMHNDKRLPHIAAKLDSQIDKTALGASRMIPWEFNENIAEIISNLKIQGFAIIGLEQTDKAQELHKFNAPDKIALLLGTEVSGIPEDILEQTDAQIAIPMLGEKESFNVVQAAAMALYRLRFYE